jgi:hypothetical protein
MHSDPIALNLFLTILGFCFGFFGCGLFAARRIRRAEIDGWKQGVRFYQDRETAARQPRL